MRSNTGNHYNRKPAAFAMSAAALALTACNVAQGPAVALRPPPYLALNAGATDGPTVHRTGYFAEENGCVVFHNGATDQAMTPVFPAGQTLLATDGTQWLGLLLNDSPIAMREVYRVGGPALPAGEALPLATPAPAGCPSSYVVVKSVHRTIAANIGRFCSGVTLCRSFGIE